MLRVHSRYPGCFRFGANVGQTFTPSELYSNFSYRLSRKENLSLPVDLCGLVTCPLESSDQWYQLFGNPIQEGTTRRGKAMMRMAAYTKNVQKLFTDWSFVGEEMPSIVGENNCYHLNIFGTVEEGVHKNSFFYDPTSEWSDYLTRHYLAERNGNCQDNCSILVLGDTGFSPLSDGYLHEFLLSIVDTVNSGGVDYSVGTVSYRHRQLEFDIEDTFVSRISFYWSYVIDNPSLSYLVYDCWRIEWRLQYNFSATYFEEDIPFDIRDVVSYNWKYYSSAVEVHYEWPRGSPAPPQDLPSSGMVLGINSDIGPFLATGNSQPRFRDLVHVDSGNRFYHGDSSPTDFSFLRYGIEAQSIERDCYVTNFFSSKEAIDKQLAALQANHLENLFQLGKLLEVFTPGSELLKIFLNLKRGKFSLHQFLKFLSNAQLVFKFSLAPTLSDAQEIALRSSTLLKLLRQSLTDNVTYGSYSIDVPEGLINFPGARIVGRSKVVMSLNRDTYLPYFLTADSWGLLPSLSRTWDLLPGSFIADWFLHIGAKLEAVDTAVKFLLLDVSYSTHSVSIIWDFPEDIQEEYGFSVVPDGSTGVLAGYKYYFRYVLQDLPVFTPTRLPVFGELSIPDWKTVGALLYTWGASK